jgi:serine/threonine protein kinase
LSRRILAEDIANEARVVSSLRENGGHMNIVRVLDHGWLTGSLDVYFIDMELGSFTLADYIDYIHDRGPNLSKAIINSIPPSTDPAFVPGNCPVHERMENVMAIGYHIAQGLEFMHSLHHVHRDLKPSNGKSPL